ncbi:hypothetical protein KY5_1951 [Streptomyces formicae]|uniref:Uncharacterized protein n=1 Tax=Streptomyces formicae TaxID=1616117 RepID=A0A291Q5I0_9ACTN|nr:hypothetical protein KY5_1951 [Streptomyces formicae]
MRTRRTLLTALLTTAAASGGLATAATASPAPARTVEVSTAAELKSALADASPGDTIHLADGTYSGNFKTSVAASANSRVTMTGSPKAVLTAGGGYGLHLNITVTP